MSYSDKSCWLAEIQSGNDSNDSSLYTGYNPGHPVCDTQTDPDLEPCINVLRDTGTDRVSSLSLGTPPALQGPVGHNMNRVPIDQSY